MTEQDLRQRIDELEEENRRLKLMIGTRMAFEEIRQRCNPSCMLVSSVLVEEGPAHDVVRVWNRGGMCGELVVVKGDGKRVAALLDQSKRHLRIEPARETHLLASVHVVRAPGGFNDREGVWISVDSIGTVDGEDYVDLNVMSIVWHEDGRGERGADYVVRAWPTRQWDPNEKRRRIERLYSTAQDTGDVDAKIERAEG